MKSSILFLTAHETFFNPPKVLALYFLCPVRLAIIVHSLFVSWKYAAQPFRWPPISNRGWLSLSLDNRQTPAKNKPIPNANIYFDVTVPISFSLFPPMKHDTIFVGFLKIPPLPGPESRDSLFNELLEKESKHFGKKQPAKLEINEWNNMIKKSEQKGKTKSNKNHRPICCCLSLLSPDPIGTRSAFVINIRFFSSLPLTTFVHWFHGVLLFTTSPSVFIFLYSSAPFHMNTITLLSSTGVSTFQKER